MHKFFVMYYLILFFIVAEWLFSRVLSVLDIRASRAVLPDELSDIYDAEAYRKQQSYLRTNANFGWLVTTVSLVVTLLFVALGGIGWLDGLLRSWLTDLACKDIYREALVSVLFFALISVCSTLIAIPFDYYDNFVIEQRFGFNKSTKGQFVKDSLTNLLLSLFLQSLIVCVLSLIYLSLPDYFWLLAFGAVTLFSLFMSEFYSLLIVPLFNKQTPLPVGELRDSIESFARKVDFPLTEIYVLDASKRSTKANAYFTGLGRNKRVVLYDTLIEQLSTEEIVAVLAHEIGHYKHCHNWKMMAVSSAVQLLIFILLGYSLSSESLAFAAGAGMASFHVNVYMFGFLYTPLNIVLQIAVNALSRCHEYQADAFARDNGVGMDLISGLKKITAQAMSNLTPHPARVFCDYSHPTLLQRIQKINS